MIDEADWLDGFKISNSVNAMVEEMVNNMTKKDSELEEILLRTTNPTVRDAYEKYQIVLNLARENNDSE